MLKRFIPASVAALAGFTCLLAGCQNSPGMETRAKADNTPIPSGKSAAPLLASASSPATAPAVAASAGSDAGQPVVHTADLPPAADVHPGEVVVHLKTAPNLQKLQITRGQLDDLLYKTYGMQAAFDLVELQLAKNTLETLGQTLNTSDIDRERDIVFSQMFKGDKADYEAYFNQFLQKEKIKREVFEIQAIQTSAALRKIVEPMVVGKFSEAAIHQGYELLYGANRQIADITLSNQLDASKAREKLNKMPFEQVAREMSIDADTRDNGGVWAPFSFHSGAVPQVIKDTAFSIKVGDISDTLQDGPNCHIIKVLSVIEPKAQKFEDVKDSVKETMEKELIEKKMKYLREQLQLQAQASIQFDDPVLKKQWDEVLARQQPKAADKNAVRSEMAHQAAAGK